MIDVFTKYAWVKSLKDKEAETVLNDFIKIIIEPKRKPNKSQVDQGQECYNIPIQKWLDHNDILIYSKHNGGKSAVAERFIKIFKKRVKSFKN